MSGIRRDEKVLNAVASVTGAGNCSNSTGSSLALVDEEEVFIRKVLEERARCLDSVNDSGGPVHPPNNSGDRNSSDCDNEKVNTDCGEEPTVLQEPEPRKPRSRIDMTNAPGAFACGGIDSNGTTMTMTAFENSQRIAQTSVEEENHNEESANPRNEGGGGVGLVEANAVNEVVTLPAFPVDMEAAQARKVQFQRSRKRIVFGLSIMCGALLLTAAVVTTLVVARNKTASQTNLLGGTTQTTPAPSNRETQGHPENETPDPTGLIMDLPIYTKERRTHCHPRAKPTVGCLSIPTLLRW